MGGEFSAHLNKQVSHLVACRIIHSPKYSVRMWIEKFRMVNGGGIDGKEIGHSRRPCRLCRGLLESVASWFCRLATGTHDSRRHDNV